MLGFKFIKAQPTDYIMQIRTGRVIREGAGLSFFAFRPTSSIVLIPLATTDIPFIFQGVTQDFQEVTVQGVLTYRVNDPKKLSEMMNFTLAKGWETYTSEDPQKLPQRLINQVQVLARTSLQSMKIRDSLNGIDQLVEVLNEKIRSIEMITKLGVEILGLSILAIKPTPDTARALEAEAREQILREADEAVYSRRNAAVEQERNIKENELNTEIAVENKKRQIRETQMDADKSVQQKTQEINEMKIRGDITLEAMNKDLSALTADNLKVLADAKVYAVAELMKAVAKVDPRILQSLTNVNLDSAQLVALSFKELAQSAEKIGQLNISPDLLKTLLDAPVKGNEPSHRK